MTPVVTTTSIILSSSTIHNADTVVAVADYLGRPGMWSSNERRSRRQCSIKGCGAEPSSFFFYSILRWSVAVSIMRRQSSRIAAFLQADARPMFCWPRSASTAGSQVWLGLSDSRFKSEGSTRITAATARWWSSCGELRAIVQRAANVCQ